MQEEPVKNEASATTEEPKKEEAPAETPKKAEEPKAEAAAPGAGDAEKGKSLYAKCAGCHGADGKTKALGQSDVIAGMSIDAAVADLKGYKAGTLNKHNMGNIMKGQAAGLSDEDISALAAYISSLK